MIDSLKVALKSFPKYEYTPDTLFYNDKPFCSLNNLKQIRVSDEGITLEFEDAESVMLRKDEPGKGIK